MKGYNEKQKQFIDGVWRSVKYLEYFKVEEEIIVRKKQMIRKEKNRTIICLATPVLLISILSFIILGINLASVFLFGSLALGTSCIYEYVCEKDFVWGRSHGNKN